MADPSTASTDAALLTLRSTITNLSTLLERLRTALDSPTPSPTTPQTPSSNNVGATAAKPNALLLLHTSATLLRAQTTKVSLLALNKPYTPSALTTALGLYARILPSLVSATQQLSAPPPPSSSHAEGGSTSSPAYPGFFHTEVKNRVKAALAGLEGLLSEVPRSEADAARSASVEHNGREGREGQTLRGTGVVWEECDWLVSVAEKGVAGLAAGKIKAWGELVADALGEVEEWVEDGEDDGDDLADGMDGLDVGGSDAGGGNLFGEQPFREELRPLAEEVIETLKMVKLLFPPLLKRRVATFPLVSKDSKEEDRPSEEMCERLHWMVERCGELSDETDEVIAALYAGNNEETRDWLKEVREMAIACVEGARLTWNGEEDVFSAWTGKWAIKLTDTLARFIMPRVNPNPQG